LINKIELLKWEGYEETYFFLIEDLWIAHDDAKANDRGEWIFAKDGL
jgi:hypothetical protein